MPPRVNVTYGLNVTLYCKVMGSPKPKIEWLRGVRPDFRPLPFNGKYTLGRDNSLVIRDVKLGDKGFYTCMARNSINADSKSVEIIVTGMSKSARKNRSICVLLRRRQVIETLYKSGTISRPMNNSPSCCLYLKVTDMFKRGPRLLRDIFTQAEGLESFVSSF